MVRKQLPYQSLYMFTPLLCISVRRLRDMLVALRQQVVVALVLGSVLSAAGFLRVWLTQGDVRDACAISMASRFRRNVLCFASHRTVSVYAMLFAIRFSQTSVHVLCRVSNGVCR